MAERILVWQDSAEEDLIRVERVLARVNPHHWTVERIKAHVERSFYEHDMMSYVSTAGWCVTVYPTSNPDIWNACVTLTPYTIDRYFATR